MVGNVGLWPAKTLEWRRVAQDLRNGGPLEMLTIAKVIKIKVLLHQFWNLIITFDYIVCVFKAKFRIKNIQISFMVNH